MKNNKILLSLIIYIFGAITLQLFLDNIINSENIFLYSAGLIINHLILILIFYFFNKIEIIKMFKDFKNNYHKYLVISLKYFIIGFILVLVANYFINIIINNNVINSNETLVREQINKYLGYSLISTIILAPITEELVFRLGFNQIKNKYLFLIITSLSFALLHVLADLTSLISLLYLIPYLILGFAFGLTYYKTNNIFTSIITHSLHNFLTITLVLILS